MERQVRENQKEVGVIKAKNEVEKGEKKKRKEKI
jgi:hypothetical protein